MTANKNLVAWEGLMPGYVRDLGWPGFTKNSITPLFFMRTFKGFENKL